MTDQPDPEELRRLQQEAWEREFGPEVPSGKKKLIGIAAVVAFLALIGIVVLQSAKEPPPGHLPAPESGRSP